MRAERIAAAVVGLIAVGSWLTTDFHLLQSVRTVFGFVHLLFPTVDEKLFHFKI